MASHRGLAPVRWHGERCGWRACVSAQTDTGVLLLVPLTLIFCGLHVPVLFHQGIFISVLVRSAGEMQEEGSSRSREVCVHPGCAFQRAKACEREKSVLNTLSFLLPSALFFLWQTEVRLHQISTQQQVKRPFPSTNSCPCTSTRFRRLGKLSWAESFSTNAKLSRFGNWKGWEKIYFQETWWSINLCPFVPCCFRGQLRAGLCALGAGWVCFKHSAPCTGQTFSSGSEKPTADAWQTEGESGWMLRARSLMLCPEQSPSTLSSPLPCATLLPEVFGRCLLEMRGAALLYPNTSPLNSSNQPRSCRWKELFIRRPFFSYSSPWDHFYRRKRVSRSAGLAGGRPGVSAGWVSSPYSERPIRLAAACEKKTRLRGCHGGKWTSCGPLSDVFQTMSLSGSKLHSSLLLQHLQKADKGIGPASPGAGLPILVPTISSRARLTTTLTPRATAPGLLPI